MFLVKRLGGSPGKLVMRMRISKVDGTSVGYKEACIRYSVLLFIVLVSSVGLVISALNMPDPEYAALTPCGYVFGVGLGDFVWDRRPLFFGLIAAGVLAALFLLRRKSRFRTLADEVIDCGDHLQNTKA